MLVELDHKREIHFCFPFFTSFGSYIQNFLDNLPEDIYKKCNARLWISVSRVSGLKLKNDVIKNFDSKEHLETIIRCSTFIPIISGWRLPKINDKVII